MSDERKRVYKHPVEDHEVIAGYVAAKVNAGATVLGAVHEPLTIFEIVEEDGRPKLNESNRPIYRPRREMKKGEALRRDYMRAKAYLAPALEVSEASAIDVGTAELVEPVPRAGQVRLFTSESLRRAQIGFQPQEKLRPGRPRKRPKNVA